MSPELCLQQLPVMRRGRGEAEGVEMCCFEMARRPLLQIARIVTVFVHYSSRDLVMPVRWYMNILCVCVCVCVRVCTCVRVCACARV